MNAPDPTREPAPSVARTLLALFGLPVGAMLGGALLCPWIFNAITAHGRANPSRAFLRELEFESTFSRCILVLVVIGLPFTLRAAGIRSWSALGWPRTGDGVRRFGRAMLFGALSLLGLFLAGWAGGAYTLRVEPDAFRAGEITMILLGAVLVGLIEETLFRGFYYKGLRRVAGGVVSALLGSAWFAVLHFAKPFVRAGVVHAEWNDGLLLLADCFHTGHVAEHYVPFILTLFVMGLTLCRMTEVDGTLHRAAGLHAGWVVVIRWGMLVWDRPELPTPGFFGGSDLISKSWACFFFACAWLLWELRKPVKREA